MKTWNTTQTLEGENASAKANKSYSLSPDGQYRVERGEGTITLRKTGVHQKVVLETRGERVRWSSDGERVAISTGIDEDSLSATVYKETKATRALSEFRRRDVCTTRQPALQIGVVPNVCDVACDRVERFFDNGCESDPAS